MASIGGLVGGLIGARNASRDSRIARDEMSRSRLPVLFNAGGFNTNMSVGPGGERIVGVGSDTMRNNVLNQLANTFGSRAGEITTLLPQVRPGFGRLTEARVQAIQNAREQSIGNLRQNLARRRIAGSSFGEDAVARQELMFSQQEEQARAESFLAELELTNSLMNERMQANVNQNKVFLDNLNMEADIALRMQQQYQQVWSQASTNISNMYSDLASAKFNFWMGTGAQLGADIANFYTMGGYGMAGGSGGNYPQNSMVRSNG